MTLFAVQPVNLTCWQCVAMATENITASENQEELSLFIAKDDKVLSFLEKNRGSSGARTRGIVCPESLPWRNLCISSSKGHGRESKCYLLRNGCYLQVGYWPYLSKVADNFTDMQPLMEMRPFLSVVHAKAHTAKCEVRWGGRNQDGAGNTVGEEV